MPEGGKPTGYARCGVSQPCSANTSPAIAIFYDGDRCDSDLYSPKAILSCRAVRDQLMRLGIRLQPKPPSGSKKKCPKDQLHDE